MATPQIPFTTPPKTKQRIVDPTAIAELPYHRHIPWCMILPDGDDNNTSSKSSSFNGALPTLDNGQPERVFAISEGSVNIPRTSPLSQNSDPQSGAEAEPQTKSQGHEDNDTKQADEPVPSATRAELLAEMDRVREKRLGKEPFPGVFSIWKRC